jgi:hypothetical protein
MSIPHSATLAFSTPDVLDDPLPLLRRIRDESPVAAVPQIDGYLIETHRGFAAFGRSDIRHGNATMCSEPPSPDRKHSAGNRADCGC